MNAEQKNGFGGFVLKAGKYAGSVLVVAGIVYFILSARFVTRPEWDEHSKWAAQKSIQVDLTAGSQISTNQQLIDELKGMRGDFKEMRTLIEDIHYRVVILETKSGSTRKK